MSEKKEEKPKFIAWFSELGRDSGPIAGGKGANLGEMFNSKFPVPPGFVVTAQAYDYFINKSNLASQIKEIIESTDVQNTTQLNENTQKIRELVQKAQMPKEMEEEILEAYEELDINHDAISNAYGTALDILKRSHEPAFVAVRSSATTEDLATASFAGQQDTYLNVKGNTQLITHIKKCFASLFTARAAYYRKTKGFEHDEAKLAVVVQKMINSDKSGVMFSRDPTYSEANKDNIIIEAVFGLGEGIVSGQIKPDHYVLNRDLEILETKVANKKIALTRNSGGGKQTVQLTPELSNAQVLKGHELKRLGDYAIKLEEHYNKPQDIEFAIESGEIYIVQTRAITTISKEVQKAHKKIEGKIILSGQAASPGIASGVVKIIKSMEDLPKVKKGDILVTTMTNPDMVVTMQKSAAIVTDEGGMTSHAAIVSREMGIPAIVGTQEATQTLVDGKIITVDGFTGNIYEGKTSENIQQEILPISEKTKTKIKVIVDLPSAAERAAKSKAKTVGLTRIEGIIAEAQKHPAYFLQNKKMGEYEEIIYKGIEGIAKYFEEVWVRTSDLRSDEFSNLEGAPEIEGNPMLGMHGIRYSLKYPEILEAELKALKRVAEKGKTLGILMPQLVSVSELQEVKKYINKIGFRNLKVGIMIETPAAVQIIEDLCKEGISFISFGTNDLTQYTLAIDRNNSEVQYLHDETHPAVLRQIAYVIEVCKRYNVETSICGQAGSKKSVAKFLIEKGITSITVNADAASEISEYVAELEEKHNFNNSKSNKKFEEIEDSQLTEEIEAEDSGEEKLTKEIEEDEEEDSEEEYIEDSAEIGPPPADEENVDFEEAFLKADEEEDEEESADKKSEHQQVENLKEDKSKENVEQGRLAISHKGGRKFSEEELGEVMQLSNTNQKIKLHGRIGHQQVENPKHGPLEESIEDDNEEDDIQDPSLDNQEMEENEKLDIF